MPRQLRGREPDQQAAPAGLLARMAVLNGLQTALTTAWTLIAIWLLSPDQRGLMVLGLFLGTTIGLLASLGTGSSFRALLPRQDGESARRDMIAGFTWFSAAAIAPTGVLVAGTAVLSARWADHRLAGPGLLLAIALVAISQMLLSQASDAAYAEGHFRVGSRTLFRAAAGSLVGVVVALTLSRTAQSALLGQAGGALLVLFREIPVLAGAGLLHFGTTRTSTIRRLIRTGAPVSGSNLGLLVALRADRYVLGLCASAATVGVYSLAATLSEVARVGTMAVAQVYLRDVATGNGARRLGRMTRTALFVALATTGPVAIGGWLLIPPVFGPAYAPARVLLLILLLAELAFTPYLVVSRGLLGGGWTVSSGIAGVVTGLGAVGCYAVGARLHGAAGLAAASAVAYLLMAIVYGGLLRRRLRASVPVTSNEPVDQSSGAAVATSPERARKGEAAMRTGDLGRTCSPAFHRPVLPQLGAVRFPALVVSCWLAYAAVVTYALTAGAGDATAVLIIVPILMSIGLPILTAVTRTDAAAGILRIMVLGMVLKFVASIAQIVIDRRVYGGLQDAQLYHDRGDQLAAAWHSGQYTLDALGNLTDHGVRALCIITGLVAYVVGSNTVAQYLVFSWFGFWGLVLFYLAYRTVVADASCSRYARAVFFLPSLAYWSSGLGKDSCMTFLLGLAAFGSARVLADRSGSAALALGLLGMAFVRPHVAVLVFAALCVAYVLKRRSTAPGVGMSKRALVAVTLVAAGVLLYLQMGSFFGGGGDFSFSAGQQIYADQRISNAGTANFDAPHHFSLMNLPWALVTVLFRPFFFEAGNAVMLICSLESLVLLVVCVLVLLRRHELYARIRSNPFLVMSTVFVMMFCLVFSGLANFGLLARERSQMMPFVLALLCATIGTAAAEKRATGSAPASVEQPREPVLVGC